MLLVRPPVPDRICGQFIQIVVPRALDYPDTDDLTITTDCCAHDDHSAVMKSSSIHWIVRKRCIDPLPPSTFASKTCYDTSSIRGRHQRFWTKFDFLDATFRQV